VAIQVRYLDMNVATYNARPPFEPATDDTATANNLFLIIAGPVETVQGQTLSVHAELADRTGEDRCADITIVAAAP
jgi:hypothetical protein